MAYRKIFNPEPFLQDFRDDNEKQGSRLGDQRDGKIYRYTDEIVLAVNVAIATGRPLLVRGRSGCGKSSLAYNIARVMKRRYYEYVITSRTQARDLLWRFDAVRRLGDAQFCSRMDKGTHQWDTYYPYIEPGILWWVFDGDKAKQRGQSGNNSIKFKIEVKDPVIFKPQSYDGKEIITNRTVILLDEIDKADPDFANNLLVPFGSLEFWVDEIQEKIEFQKPKDRLLGAEDLPLVVITTNDERQLPDAFLRRCVILEIREPDIKVLIEIARATEGEPYEKIADTMQEMLERKHTEEERLPSISEFLDTVRACLQLQAEGDSLNSIVDITTWKETDLRQRNRFDA